MPHKSFVYIYFLGKFQAFKYVYTFRDHKLNNTDQR